MRWTENLPNGRRIFYTLEGFDDGPCIVGAYVEGDVVGIAQASASAMTQEEVETWAQDYATKTRT